MPKLKTDDIEFSGEKTSQGWMVFDTEDCEGYIDRPEAIEIAKHMIEVFGIKAKEL